MSKWIVQLDYEFGEFEPNSIYFRRVCSDDFEYSFAYDTKKEALEAFCLGQVAMREMLKEREAEQKEDEQKKEEQKEVKVDMSEETRKRLEKLAPMSIIKIGWKAKAETSPYDGSITSVSFCEVVDGYPTKDEALKALVEKRSGGDGKEDCSDGLKEYAKPDFKVKVKSPTEERLTKIEQRLTEIDGVLTSIGSPDYDLRKKVDGLEKGLAQLADTFYICANNETHNYEDLRKKVEELENAIVYLRSKSLAPPWNSQDYPKEPPPVRYDNKVEYYKDNILDK